MAQKLPKFIFVCGGVLSGVGKGIVTSSLGLLLKQDGYSVTAVKIDPYVSIDAGLMRPAEHGETFVTEDGGEIDQDLGNYERFLGVELSRKQNITTGKVFQSVIEDERSMKYGGRDVEMIPDVINKVEAMIMDNYHNEDFVLVEVGGTTGDIENLPFLYAARELGREFQAVYIMVTYLPYLRSVGELKTKPTQHAVANIRSVGIMPDFIVTRNEVPLDEPRKETISKRCFIDVENIIDNPDLDTIYAVPLNFHESGFAEKVLAKFKLKPKNIDLSKYKKFVKAIRSSEKTVRIGLVGKYVQHGSGQHLDSYISVLEAIKHAAGHQGYKPEIVMINSHDFEKDPKSVKMLKDIDGVIVPRGWGSRGAEGKITAIEYIRKNKIPYLGLCYGMQMAVIEYARNVLKWNDANSEEVDSKTKHPVIHIMPDQKEYLAKMQYGGTIRLGGWDCVLDKKSLSYSIYKKHDAFKNLDKAIISERHRHRYEFNNEFREELEKAGLVMAGTSPDGKLVEFIELPKDVHPFFIGTQAHPEYKSQLMKPHPLFLEFIRAAARS